MRVFQIIGCQGIVVCDGVVIGGSRSVRMLHSPVLSEGGSCCSEGGLRPLIRVCLFVHGCGVFCSVFEEVAGREVRAGISAKGEGPRSSVRPVSCSCGCAFGFGGSVMQCIVWGVVRQVRVDVCYVFLVW